MEIAANNHESFSNPIPAEGQAQGETREEYSTPKLSEFGSIRKITANFSGSNTL